MDDQFAYIIWSVGALVLVGSALAGRKLPLKNILKMALLWVAIIAGGVMIVSFLGG